MDKPIVLGTLGTVYGIKGWLKVNSFTDVAEAIFDYKPWLIHQNGEWRELKVSAWKRHNKGLICKLDGIDVREDALALTNVEIGVPADQLPDLPDGEFYWRDLIGCSVMTTKGYDLGKVTELMETGSNDVLVVEANVKDAFGAKERLIPFLEEQVIKNIDLTARTIEVDWDPGF
ncbi:ribosome maturation factor RimM [Aeromonas molluscorum]|uniref:Ribosome maturation factor RimM n=1 Tax=Aeromonas molluscorum 848 TaxID=1268236 RepID=R1GZ74_9GAMM|nr:ribosome maturation factor RimM [Aeromonas molluscorum]EOD56775.1 16S rRNA-processing protein RimM [Aeromonas molluscorum 848]